jgi:5'-3' exoribonuclease 1
MGIPSYFSYIVKKHADIIKKFIDNKFVVSNLYMDCNSIIYDSYYKLNAETETFTETMADRIIGCVILKIEEYLAIIQPTHNVIIAFDGVAPVAKLEQQRQRRYKSWYQNEISNQIFNKTKKDAWSTAAITPGTKFMSELNERVSKHFSNSEKYKVNKIYVSGSNIYGEGEHKIFDFIRKYPDKHTSNFNTVIYGLDADLIMLSINHLPVCPNIFLFRETPQFIQSINAELEPDQHYFLDIPELTNEIIKYMNNTDTDTNSLVNVNVNKVYDYIFLCFFLGNDFLPHFPALNIRTGGVDKMLNAYRATITQEEFLSDGKNINWNNVRKVVKFLADLEEEFIITEYKSRNKKERLRMPETTAEEKFKRFEAIPLYEREIEKFIDPVKPCWQSRYYRSLHNIKSDSDGQQVKDICVNYLEGLEWTMKYYTTSCPNWRWRYKYNYPPLLQDLLRFIPVFDTTFVPIFEPRPVSELVQLCYVLPRSSLHLLPVALYTELIKRYEHWYKVDCEYLWAYCRYFWESHVEMEEIDLQVLEKFIELYQSTIIQRPYLQKTK